MHRITKKASTETVADWSRLRPQVTPGLLAEITRRIVDRFQPDRVVLFGSHALGSPHVYSDLDLLVVMKSRESMARRIRRVAEVAHVPFLPMDVLVHTPREIKKRLLKGDTFMAEILTKGRVLYEHKRGR
jgi:predicted nucleotidyltransferase